MYTAERIAGKCIYQDEANAFNNRLFAQGVRAPSKVNYAHWRKMLYEQYVYIRYD